MMRLGSVKRRSQVPAGFSTDKKLEREKEKVHSSCFQSGLYSFNNSGQLSFQSLPSSALYSKSPLRLLSYCFLLKKHTELSSHLRMTLKALHNMAPVLVPSFISYCTPLPSFHHTEFISLHTYCSPSHIDAFTLTNSFASNALPHSPCPANLLIIFKIYLHVILFFQSYHLSTLWVPPFEYFYS